MNRNLKTSALILKNYRVGEYHKGTVLLTKDLGIINAVAYGGYKTRSKLGSKTEVFNYLRLYLYHDPVKNTYKITDTENVEIYENIRNDLKSIMTATLCCEIVLKTYGGGGEYSGTLSLMRTAFSGFNAGERDSLDRSLIQFLWRYAGILGFRFNLTECSQCGNAIKPGENCIFSAGDENFICSRCAVPADITLPPGCRTYLLHTDSLDFFQSLRVGLPGQSQKDLKALLIHILKSIVETDLNTVTAGGEFL